MRIALVAPVLALAALPAGVAHATPPLYTGTTCSLVAATLDGRSYVGVLDASVAAVDLVHLDGNPTEVSITCEVVVIGGATHTRRADGVVAAVLAETIQFDVDPADTVQVCTTVVAADAQGSSTQLGRFCREAPETLGVRTVLPEWIALR